MLDDRLQAVADFVPTGISVADIGTDHGYLAIELKRLSEERCVIAADKNGGPCEAARKTLRECGLEDAIEVRQGDGLAALVPGEVEAVCIAGMGGKLIADILAAQPEVFGSLKMAVLQPQNAYSTLRRWLYEHDWHIEDEALAKVDGRVYQVILAAAGCESIPGELELMLGPVLLQKRPELFAKHVQNNIESILKIISGLKKSSQPDEIRIGELMAKKSELEGLL